MELTVADIEEQLTYLLKAQVDDPRWSQSSLLNLPIVERQFTASRQVGLRPAQANLNLALCLLQATNQLVPASPLGHARAWKMLLGAELNCLGAVRGYTAASLLSEVPSTVTRVFRECAKQTALTAPEIIDAQLRALKQLVSRNITALWLWKTGEPPAFTTSADWRDLIDKFSAAQVWTRDVIYAQRAKFIKELAKYLASEQAASQLPGLGPEIFDTVEPPTIRPPIADVPAVSIPSDEASKSTTPSAVPIGEVSVPTIDTLQLYLDRVLPPAPQYIPEEWQSLIGAAAATPQAFIRGEAGSGKTHLLFAVGQALKQAGQVPLYVRLSDYASYAREQDIFQFVATRGGFGQLNRDDALRRDFEAALVDAQQIGRLIVLADQSDDLLESEIPEITRRLREVQRVLIAERSPRLPLARSNETTLLMPRLSTASIIPLVASSQSVPTNFESVVTELNQAEVTITPSLAIFAARNMVDTGDRHPVTFIGAWIDQMLRETRALGRVVAVIDKARELLRNLAGLRTGVATHAAPSTGLTRDDVRHACRQFQLPIEDDTVWQLVDLLERSGCLSRAGEEWIFANVIVERYLAVEYAATHNLFWIALHPSYQTTARWLAAYLARRGSDQQTKQFFDHLRKAVTNATSLSILEVAEYLVEFREVGRTVEPQFVEATIDILRDLSQVKSDRVRSEVAQHAAQLGIDLEMPKVRSIPFDVLLPADLAHWARDLSGLLREINIKPPKGGEREWLEKRTVINELVRTLVKTSVLDLKLRCAAWLQQSSLSMVISLFIDPDALWRTHTRPALEVLAEVAKDADTNAQTAFVARSVLCKDDFIVQLWQHGDEYRALVFDLLLAQNKRLAIATLSPNERKWQVVG